MEPIEPNKHAPNTCNVSTNEIQEALIKAITVGYKPNIRFINSYTGLSSIINTYKNVECVLLFCDVVGLFVDATGEDFEKTKSVLCCGVGATTLVTSRDVIKIALCWFALVDEWERGKRV